MNEDPEQIDVPEALPEPVPAGWLEIFDWQIPFAILAITLFITNVIQFATLREQSKNLQDTELQVNQNLMPTAQKVHAKLNSLAEDLVELAKTDPDAHQIQDELKIQINNPPPPSQPSNSSTPATAP